MKKLAISLLVGLILMFGNVAKAQEIIMPIAPITPVNQELACIERIQQSAVSIFSIGTGFGRCSGVLTKNQYGLSYIITAKHCINTAEEMYVENKKVEFIITSQNDDLTYLIVKGTLKDKIPAKLAKENAKLEIKYII